MKVSEPKYVWDQYKRKTGELEKAKEIVPAISCSLPLYGLDESAPDDVKMQYERYVNIRLKSLARYFVPTMESPYYTWEGKIVERSSIRNRRLPLFD